MNTEGRAREGAGGAAAAASWLARSWVVRGVAIGLAVAFVGLALYGNALYRRALADECVPLPPIDLTMDELIAVRKRVQAYQVDPAPEAALVLGAAEIGAVYGDGESLTFRILMLGDRARIDLTLPTEGGCWNVVYAGQVSVDKGLMTLIPDELKVGDTDLGPFVRHRRLTLRSEQVPDDTLSKLLGNTSTMWVEDGFLHVRLSNRWDVW